MRDCHRKNHDPIHVLGQSGEGAVSDRRETAKRPEQLPGTRGKGPAADPLVTEGAPDLTSRFSDPQPQPWPAKPQPPRFRTFSASGGLEGHLRNLENLQIHLNLQRLPGGRLA